MRVKSMTATFGKLENKTLTLKPGLNIIEAPNEWGKSTWCAFLAAMLYGLDTRAKSTKMALAEKERYQPWSGAPMAGRLEIVWQGREITIERRTKGRIPLGDFRAYETKSGLSVPELTAANCGQMLLGVEKSVFLRSALIRQNDLPLTGDEALRRRLQNLVTTGDESGAGEHLAKQLKELKNRCRYNRTGLLPQAESERDALEERIGQIQRLESAVRDLDDRQAENTDWIGQLRKHKAYLSRQAALGDAQRVQQARQELRQAEARLQNLTELPERKQSAGWKLFLSGLLMLAGALLGIFWNEAAGIGVALPGLALLILGRAGLRKQRKDRLEEARQAAARSREHYETLLAMAKPMPEPAESVGLTLNAQETAQKLEEARAEQLQLQSRRSQILGRMEALGGRKTLEDQLDGVKTRIEKLENMYMALTLAQETLAEAAAQLQRRFAPQITEGAARRMQKLTHGRYDRVVLNEDLALLAAAQGEETLREAGWRSAGTVDQLYLALRLSVAEVLIPASPLILDDAFVRFDDERLKAALALLQEESGSRQVILFTCQSREKLFASDDLSF